MDSGSRVIVGDWISLMIAIGEEKMEAAGVLLKAGTNVNMQLNKTYLCFIGIGKRKNQL